MKLFGKKNIEDASPDIIEMVAIYEALPQDKKEELAGLQQAEYQKVFKTELDLGQPHEDAEVFADCAVETLTKKFIDEWKKSQVETPAPELPADSSLPPLPQAQPAAKKKYTFEFEVYEGGAMKRNASVSTLEENKAAAYPIAEAALKAELTGKETFRYTGLYKSEAVTIENI
jgi:hypothetical protein